MGKSIAKKVHRKLAGVRKYVVNFCMSYHVDAESEDEALAKATDEFANDLPALKIREFGANVEEA